MLGAARSNVPQLPSLRTQQQKGHQATHLAATRPATDRTMTLQRLACGTRVQSISERNRWAWHSTRLRQTCGSKFQKVLHPRST
jgi:hypothetical protein|eukprot:COSAG02_NODE_339_length_24201_cov_45.538462_18_plen_84_part_00